MDECSLILSDNQLKGENILRTTANQTIIENQMDLKNAQIIAFLLCSLKLYVKKRDEHIVYEVRVKLK